MLTDLFIYYASSNRIAMRIKDNTHNLVFFLFADQLGSTNVTSDQNGLMVSLSRYKPWGESNGGQGPGRRTMGLPGNAVWITLAWTGTAQGGTTVR